MSRLVSNLIQSFKKLAGSFEQLKFEVDDLELPQPPPQRLWIPRDISVELAACQPIVELTHKYRDLVKTGGELVIQVYDTDLLIDVDGLNLMITAFRVGNVRHFAHTSANLFGLLAGGPAVEIENQDGTISVVEKPVPGWPINFIPNVRSRRQIELERLWEGTGKFNKFQLLLPDSHQCVHYGKYCRFLSSKFPEERLNLPDKAAKTANDGPVLPDKFVYRGAEYDVPKGVVCRLIFELWNAESKTVLTSDLAGPVWDHSVDVTPGRIGGARTKVNRFFQENGLPFRVTLVDDYLKLMDTSAP